jgi:hypothetical protein
LAELKSLYITTKPNTFQLKNGKRGVAWKATRLTFKRNGVELLTRASDFIVNQIVPKSADEGYVPGYFVLTLKEFRETFPNVINSDSYKRKSGFYNYRTPHESMKKYFIRLYGEKL